MGCDYPLLLLRVLLAHRLVRGIIVILGIEILVILCRRCTMHLPHFLLIHLTPPIRLTLTRLTRLMRLIPLTPHIPLTPLINPTHPIHPINLTPPKSAAGHPG